ncbi:50S ribosomal protein L11 methyltransferase [Candidatus Vondammii sp. HM_W22]|uniref:50S ribosomal protein L11 methyltransferase n=1 Tax=Candidatus Vondammii sp. HM_W22 TaxID=2687299 RepID=UPI002402C831|nr:50S ribosomal protein L11 methyltransferase [Candidatus Vondammii sp. HM_W22]
MSWIQAHLNTNKEKAPLIELLFENMGALSITLHDAEDEPLLEPKPGELPLRKQTRVTGLFSGETKPDAMPLTRRSTARSPGSWSAWKTRCRSMRGSIIFTQWRLAKNSGSVLRVRHRQVPMPS